MSVGRVMAASAVVGFLFPWMLGASLVASLAWGVSLSLIMGAQEAHGHGLFLRVRDPIIAHPFIAPAIRVPVHRRFFNWFGHHAPHVPRVFSHSTASTYLPHGSTVFQRSSPATHVHRTGPSVHVPSGAKIIRRNR